MPLNQGPDSRPVERTFRVEQHIGDKIAPRTASEPIRQGNREASLPIGVKICRQDTLAQPFEQDLPFGEAGPEVRGSAGVLTHIAIRKSGIAAIARIARRDR